MLRKLAEEEGLEVTPEEVEQEIDSLVGSAGESTQQLRRNLSTENARENLKSSVLNRKVMQRLSEIVQGIESESPASDATEDQQTEDADGSTTAAAEEQPAASAEEEQKESSEGA